MRIRYFAFSLVAVGLLNACGSGGSSDSSYSSGSSSQSQAEYSESPSSSQPSYSSNSGDSQRQGSAMGKVITNYHPNLPEGTSVTFQECPSCSEYEGTITGYINDLDSDQVEVRRNDNDSRQLVNVANITKK